MKLSLLEARQAAGHTADELQQALDDSPNTPTSAIVSRTSVRRDGDQWIACSQIIWRVGEVQRP